MKFDITIVGAGIVGLATAMNLLEENPDLKICILEKENEVAMHQTGNNSGVIHSGIYYTPGSEKAINCKKGYDLLLDFCDKEGIEYELCGKVIVAVNDKEVPLLDNLYNRGIENDLKGLKYLTLEELKEKEPHVNGVKGVWVPQTGIVDYKEVSQKYAEKITQMGGLINLNHKVVGVDLNKEEVTAKTNQGEFTSRLLVNCAGLYSDKIAQLTGQGRDFQILPFRGEYYKLVPDKVHMVKGLIYPVPNPEFPFLGVHFTKMIKGGAEAGPNAVLAFKREGYKNTQINLKELFETLSFSGFIKVAKKYWRDGSYEMYRSFSKKAFVKAMQTLIPSIRSEDVIKGGAGIRAQACTRDGKLVDDFLILEKEQVINVCNTPSPAATSSLAIGNTLSKKILSKLS